MRATPTLQLNLTFSSNVLLLLRIPALLAHSISVLQWLLNAETSHPIYTASQEKQRLYDIALCRQTNQLTRRTKLRSSQTEHGHNLRHPCGKGDNPSTLGDLDDGAPWGRSVMSNAHSLAPRLSQCLPWLLSFH